MNDQVTVAIIAAVPSIIAAALAYLATRQGRASRAVGVENATRLQRIEKQTNGELDRKIRQAVVEVFADHRADITQAVMMESVRNLLDVLLNSEGPKDA